MLTGHARHTAVATLAKNLGVISPTISPAQLENYQTNWQTVCRTARRCSVLGLGYPSQSEAGSRHQIVCPIKSASIMLTMPDFIAVAWRELIAMKRLVLRRGPVWGHTADASLLRSAPVTTLSAACAKNCPQIHAGDRAYQSAHVAAGSAADRVQRIAQGALQPASIHPVIGLQVPTGRLERLAPTQPAFLLRTQALIPAAVNDLLVGIVSVHAAGFPSRPRSASA